MPDLEWIEPIRERITTVASYEADIASMKTALKITIETLQANIICGLRGAQLALNTLSRYFAEAPLETTLADFASFIKETVKDAIKEMQTNDSHTKCVENLLVCGKVFEETSRGGPPALSWFCKQ